MIVAYQHVTSGYSADYRKCNNNIGYRDSLSYVLRDICSETSTSCPPRCCSQAARYQWQSRLLWVGQAAIYQSFDWNADKPQCSSLPRSFSFLATYSSNKPCGVYKQSSNPSQSRHLLQVQSWPSILEPRRDIPSTTNTLRVIDPREDGPRSRMYSW